MRRGREREERERERETHHCALCMEYGDQRKLSGVFFNCSPSFRFVYLVCMGCVVCRSKNNKWEWESVVDFHPVDPRDQTQVFGLGGNFLYLLSHLF